MDAVDVNVNLRSSLHTSRVVPRLSILEIEIRPKTTYKSVTIILGSLALGIFVAFVEMSV